MTQKGLFTEGLFLKLKKKKKVLKSGLQTTKIAKYFEIAVVLTGNGDRAALNEGRGRKKQSDTRHGNSWL